MKSETWLYFCMLIIFFFIGLILVSYSITQIVMNSNKQSSENEGLITYKNIGKRGNFGNQIFQLATLFFLAEKYNCKVLLPKKIDDLTISKIFNFSKYEKYQDIETDVDLLETSSFSKIKLKKGLKYNLTGYRQSYKYFNKSVLKYFEIDKKISEEVLKVIPKKYIAIHIRRGDYENLQGDGFFDRFTKMSKEYYIKSLEYLNSIDRDLQIIICSDNFEHPDVIEISKLKDDIILSKDLYSKLNISPVLFDFCILRYSEHLIMANSSFSWWAGYLKQENVIIPYPWWNPNSFFGRNLKFNNNGMYYPKWKIIGIDGNLNPEVKFSDFNEFEIVKIIKSLIT